MRSAALVMAAGVLAGALGGAPAALAKTPIVYTTVTQTQENAFFDIDYLYHPQLAQSLDVKRPMTWSSVQMGTFQVKLVKDPAVYERLVEGDYDEAWFTEYRSNYKVKAKVTLELWRFDGGGEIPERVDVTEGFTKVHSSTVRRTMKIGKRVTFPFKGGVDVEPGRYFLIVGVRFVDNRVFNLRFTGQENGSNTKGGYNHDKPISPECGRYKMTKDPHPGGQAYRVVPNHRPKAPDWLAPFGTEFQVVDTKVAMSCNMDGVSDPDKQIWNPGDLGMVFRGS